MIDGHNYRSLIRIYSTWPGGSSTALICVPVQKLRKLVSHLPTRKKQCQFIHLLFWTERRELQRGGVDLQTGIFSHNFSSYSINVEETNDVRKKDIKKLK